MSKNWTGIFSLILCILVGMAMLTGQFSGDSAYEIAVKNGYVGTETEWLTSLQGEYAAQGLSAYQIAQENGYTGSVTDWLASLNGDDGEDGVDGEYAGQGLSAYEIALENGFTGTEEEWLDSLKGSDGSADAVATATSVAIQSAVSVVSTFTIGTGYQVYTSISSGAGVVYWLDQANGDAYIVTNYHVVYNNDSTVKISSDIVVYLYGMEYSNYEIPAVYIGGSMNYDIAVLKVDNDDTIKTANLRAVEVSDSSKICAGDTAIAVGNPAAGGLSATAGIISVDSEDIQMTAVDETTTVTFRLMRMDTAINSGNSGGGLFGADGKLIGIVNAKVTSEDIENISFAIPANIAVGVAQNIIDNYSGTASKVSKAVLGVGTTVSESKSVYNATLNRVQIEQEVYVESVTLLGSAYGKLQVNDVLISATLDGVTYNITRSYTLDDLLLNARFNDVLTLNVERNNNPTTVNITLTNFSTID